MVVLVYSVFYYRWVQIVLTYSMFSTKLSQPQPNWVARYAVLTPLYSGLFTDQYHLLTNWYNPYLDIYIYTHTYTHTHGGVLKFPKPWITLVKWFNFRWFAVNPILGNLHISYEVASKFCTGNHSFYHPFADSKRHFVETNPRESNPFGKFKLNFMML